MQWQIHDDGSFDISSGMATLRGARPALDHEPILPLSLVIDRGPDRESIRYALRDRAVLELVFSRSGAAIALSATLEGVSQAPHWVQPISCGRLEGIDRLYRTGIGFSGPTNIVALPSMPPGIARPVYPPDGRITSTSEQQRYGFESYLVTGLIAADGHTLTVAAREVGRFMLQSHLENRIHRHQFRNREVRRNAVYLESGFSTERIALPGRSLRLPTLYLSEGADPASAMRQAAQDIAVACTARVRSPTYHACTFYERGEHFGQADLDELLVNLDRHPEPLSCVQIDGGYSAWGDWLIPNQRFPAGLEETFRTIVAHGHVPGIWVGPFMVSNRSELALRHPDWLLHWADGTRIVEWRHYTGGNAAGDQEVYVLDTSHPEALAYLVDCFTTMRRWGARFFKTDFLEWGWKDSTRVRRHVPGKTSSEYFTDFLRAIRGAIGDDSYWLGCITYFAPCIGYMDGMRVSSDVGVEWNDRPGGIGNDGCGGGTQNAVEESYGCQFFNNLWWQNDPDVTFFRERFIGMTESEIFALAVWNGILGVAMNTSDLAALSPHRRDLWRFMRPQAQPWTATLPYLAGGSRLKVAVRAYAAERSWAVVLLNDTRSPICERLLISDWIGQPSATLFRWGPSAAPALGEQTQYLAELPGHSAVLLYLSSDGRAPAAGLTLGGWKAPAHA